MEKGEDYKFAKVNGCEKPSLPAILVRREITIEDDFYCPIMHMFHYPFLVTSAHTLSTS